MARRYYLTAMALGVAMVSGCTYRAYRGDGSFRDHGFFSGTGRYTLDLGPLDLSTPRVVTYAISDLPVERFAIGLGLGHPKAEFDYSSQQTLVGTVHVTLTGPTGVLIDERRPLSQWLASSSHGYRTWFWCGGVSDTWSEQPGTAWGCQFKPTPNTSYRLRVEVLAPVTDPQLQNAAVFLEGGPRDFMP
jgi:hypothetical protein